MPDLQPCGTVAGWMRHYRKGEKPCEPCRLAQNAYTNGTKRKRRNPDGRRVWIVSDLQAIAGVFKS